MIRKTTKEAILPFTAQLSFRAQGNPLWLKINEKSLKTKQNVLNKIW